MNLKTVATTAGLLICSNIFMTFAWYAHLRNLRAKPLLVAVAASWGIAFFEYLLQVPANRLGSDVLNLSQLKIMQEVITLTVFVPFALLYMKQPIRLDFLWAGLCLMGAVYFIFRAEAAEACARRRLRESARSATTSVGVPRRASGGADAPPAWR